MPTGTCEKTGCTVADTGICLLSYPGLNACPNFHSGDGEKTAQRVALTQEPLELVELMPLPSSVVRRFPAGLELGTADAAEIMRARYTYLVGILGAEDAGKTCFLLSLYLMASRGALPPDYLFAGSQTLQGFEARARQMRQWKGGPLPEKLADRTFFSDSRQPAFLHIALRERTGAKRLFDVMLSDLPGEWTNSLVDRAHTADRFMFLHRADGIIVVVDGPLLNSRSRHSELQRSRHLLERLVRSVGVETTVPLVLLVSKCDRLQAKRPKAVDELEIYAESLGFSPEVVLCAAFSNTPENVPNGLGVFETLKKILIHIPAPSEKTGSPVNPTTSGRAFLNFYH